METLVLCPTELCLCPGRRESTTSMGLSPPTDLSIWTNVFVEKGTQFMPWKGTVRSDKLSFYEKLPQFDIRQKFGLYDEISELMPYGRPVRHCNWIRFLRFSLMYTDEVNLVATRNSSSTGEPTYEVIRPLEANTELVAFFIPDRPEDAFLLPAIQYLRHTLFKKIIDTVLEDSPLDLSCSVLVPHSPKPFTASTGAQSPSGSSDCGNADRKSVSSDSSSLMMDNSMETINAAAVAMASVMASRVPPESKQDTMISGGGTITTRRREKNLLPCSFCGKGFDRPSLLKRHIRIHTGERPHVCDICSKGFSTSSSLNTHRRIHSGEKPHQCGVCGKRFTASSNLYYHRMTHIKEKPHKCTMCSKSFPTPGDLKSHTYVHTGTWPFKCHICHRGFSKQTNLKNHLLLHSGDKPYNCDICQKKFALSCNLRTHLKTHEAEFKTSSASFALYRRTLDVLGSETAEEEETGMNEDIDFEAGSDKVSSSSILTSTCHLQNEDKIEEQRRNLLALRNIQGIASSHNYTTVSVV